MNNNLATVSPAPAPALAVGTGDIGQQAVSNLNQHNTQSTPYIPYPSPATPCNPHHSNYLLKKHKCTACGFRSVYRWVVKRHYQNIHNQSSSSNTNKMPHPTTAQIITAGNRLTSFQQRHKGQGGKLKYLTLQTLNQDAQHYDMRLIEHFKIFLAGPARQVEYYICIFSVCCIVYLLQEWENTVDC